MGALIGEGSIDHWFGDSDLHEKPSKAGEEREKRKQKKAAKRAAT